MVGRGIGSGAVVGFPEALQRTVLGVGSLLVLCFFCCFYIYLFFFLAKPCALCGAEWLMEHDCSFWNPDDPVFLASMPAECDYCSDEDITVCGKR